MKKLFIPFIALLLSSCADIYTPKYTESYNFVDFKPYTEQGFYLSTFQNVDSEYEILGPIEVLIQSGYKKVVDKRSPEELALIGSGGIQPIFGKKEDNSTVLRDKWIYAEIDNALNNMVQIAKSKDANGIICFKVECLNTKEAWIKGIAIKRK